jgi:hypothetical protein
MLRPKSKSVLRTLLAGTERTPAVQDRIVTLDEEMTELALLLPGWQAQSLEAVARSEGVSAGQIVRRLIQEYCGVRLSRFAVE